MPTDTKTSSYNIVAGLNCPKAFVEWAHAQSAHAQNLVEAWEACHNGLWLLHLASRLRVRPDAIGRVLADVVRACLPLILTDREVPAPEDADKWCGDPITPYGGQAAAAAALRAAETVERWARVACQDKQAAAHAAARKAARAWATVYTRGEPGVISWSLQGPGRLAILAARYAAGYAAFSRQPPEMAIDMAIDAGVRPSVLADIVRKHIPRIDASVAGMVAFMRLWEGRFYCSASPHPRVAAARIQEWDKTEWRRFSPCLESDWRNFLLHYTEEGRRPLSAGAGDGAANDLAWSVWDSSGVVRALCCA